MKIKIAILLSLFSMNAMAGHVYYYKNAQGDKYRICKDRDGYVVYKPGGGQDSHGNGYTWKEVKRQYGLSGWYDKSKTKYSKCP